jgi:hypothetical protein
MMMNVLTLVMLTLGCIMQWLFLFRWCVPTHFVFFLLLFFFSLSHTHTGPDDDLLNEYRQVVAIARKLLEGGLTPRSQESQAFRTWLVVVREEEPSLFPFSRAKAEKLVFDPFIKVLSARNDKSYNWSGTPAAKAEYVTAMLAKFHEWRKQRG